MIGAVLLVPQSAYAWWPGPRFAIGIRVPIAVPVAPPVYVPPVTYYPPAYYRPPVRVWIPPHYTPRGVFIPGHFVYR